MWKVLNMVNLCTFKTVNNTLPSEFYWKLKSKWAHGTWSLCGQINNCSVYVIIQFYTKSACGKLLTNFVCVSTHHNSGVWKKVERKRVIWIDLLMSCAIHMMYYSYDSDVRNNCLCYKVFNMKRKLILSGAVLLHHAQAYGRGINATKTSFLLFILPPHHPSFPSSLLLPIHHPSSSSAFLLLILPPPHPSFSFY